MEDSENCRNSKMIKKRNKNMMHKQWPIENNEIKGWTKDININAFYITDLIMTKWTTQLLYQRYWDTVPKDVRQAYP